MKNQLVDYWFNFKSILIFCDNTNTIASNHNPVLHFIPVENQLADVFTMPLDESRFNKLINELGMLNLGS